MAEENKALMKSLEWVIDIDPPAIIASVAEDRKSKPSPQISPPLNGTGIFGWQNG